jgi:hypothetical protein
MFPQLDPSLGRLCTKLPSRLNDGEEGHILFKQTFFNELAEKEKFLFHANKMIAWWRVHSFGIDINTTVGKNFTTRVRWRVRRAIWRQYCHGQKLERGA